jgi:hypothetical protein
LIFCSASVRRWSSLKVWSLQDVDFFPNGTFYASGCGLNQSVILPVTTLNASAYQITATALSFGQITFYFAFGGAFDMFGNPCAAVTPKSVRTYTFLA